MLQLINQSGHPFQTVLKALVRETFAHWCQAVLVGMN